MTRSWPRARPLPIARKRRAGRPFGREPIHRTVAENYVMQTPRTLLSILAALTLVSAAHAQSLPRYGAPDPHVKAELVAASDAVVPGQPLQVGLKLTHEKDWHTY